MVTVVEAVEAGALDPAAFIADRVSQAGEDAGLQAFVRALRVGPKDSGSSDPSPSGCDRPSLLDVQEQPDTALAAAGEGSVQPEPQEQRERTPYEQPTLAEQGAALDAAVQAAASAGVASSTSERRTQARGNASSSDRGTEEEAMRAWEAETHLRGLRRLPARKVTPLSRVRFRTPRDAP